MATKTLKTSAELLEIAKEYQQSLHDEPWADPDFIACYEPGDLTDLARYSFRLTGEMRTHDGMAWTGIISLDGKDVIHVEQEGRGGSDFRYATELGAEAQAEVRRFDEVAKKAFPNMGFEQGDHATQILDLAYTGGASSVG